METILIIGCDGMVGSYLSKHIKNFKILNVNRKKLDISDYNSINYFLSNNNIDYIINCAVVKPEYNNYDGMILSNSIGCKFLSENVKKFSNIKKLIHISTDGIFSNKSIINDRIIEYPNNVYGLTKLLGEQYIQNILDINKYLIIRCGWLYGPYTQSTFIHKFIKNYFNCIQNNMRPKCAIDDIGKPLSCYYLANFIIECIKNNVFGIVACSYKDINKMSRYDFSIYISKYWNLYNNEKIDIFKIDKCSCDDFNMKYNLPKNTFEQESIFNYINNTICNTFEKDLDYFIKNDLKIK